MLFKVYSEVLLLVIEKHLVFKLKQKSTFLDSEYCLHCIYSINDNKLLIKSTNKINGHFESII